MEGGKLKSTCYVIAVCVSETDESFLEFLYRLANPIFCAQSYTNVIMPMLFYSGRFLCLVMLCLLARINS